MAREEFIDSLRLAFRSLERPRVEVSGGFQGSAGLTATLESADLWLTQKSIGGFDVSDFAEWSQEERASLTREVNEFLAIAKNVLPTAPATAKQSRQARKHLESVMRIVRSHLLPDWLSKQKEMMDEAAAAAQSQGWHVEWDEKEMTESLLATYKAPRVSVRTPDIEVMLDPVARFGSGRKGIVDLIVLPAYETVSMIILQDGQWYLMPFGKVPRRQPFNRTTLVQTISRLPHN